MDKKTKKATINLINKKYNKLFQHTVTVALNHEKIKTFAKNNTLWRKKFPSEKDDWKKNEKNNLTIVFNVLYAKKEKLYPAYVSKYNSTGQKQVILLMIPNGEEWNYRPLKKQSALWRGITSKHYGYYNCLSCPHSFATEINYESHIKV